MIPRLPLGFKPLRSPIIVLSALSLLAHISHQIVIPFDRAARIANLDPQSTTPELALDPNAGFQPVQQSSIGKSKTTESVFNPPVNSLEELHYALETMQNGFFKIWLGKWPDAIDWTAAVMGTHVSGALYSLTRSLPYIMPGTLSAGNVDTLGAKDQGLSLEGQRIENEINKYFSQAVTYFFGEDHFAIRNQAHDDMLWVVLGWLDNIRFIDQHDDLHYPQTRESTGGGAWYGKQFSSAFAHRARVFYDLASKGWDWKLCGGGMNWSPHTKQPYKNAITNELYISASIAMYLYFPGDSNCSPFMSGHDGQKSTDYHHLAEEGDGHCDSPYKPAYPHDPVYLQSAVNGYKWLKNSNMTNDKGLYVDGFHITDFGKNGTIGTGKCDERNEMVFTYNQGVLLSGLRGLWEGTGDISYLEDGHELVRNVIQATGWESLDRIFFDLPNLDPASNMPFASPQSGILEGKWSGLGSKGILTELCDPSGTCSQNGQTFKGIFFHHLIEFCSPLPRTPLIPGKTFAAGNQDSMLHHQSCKEYAAWVVHNAQAALKTRNEDGKFGTWWGSPVEEKTDRKDGEAEKRDADVSWIEPELPKGAVDYRNFPDVDAAYQPLAARADRAEDVWYASMQPSPLTGRNKSKSKSVREGGDLNDRGRGRTVETQGGGVAVVRAMWEFVNMYTNDG